jgi:DNA-binding beta-propeller fold protein YncE
MAPWDRPVQVGKYPYSGSFTPDGRFFVVANMGWGADVAGFSAGAAPGEVSVVRLGTVERQSGQTVTPGEPHQLVSSAGVGISPEGLAISPNGRYVVTANAQGAASPDITNIGSKGGSLSLLSLDGNGTLRTIGEYPINAVPAGVTFDASGSVVGVTQFRSFDPNAIDGEVGFWRLIPGSNPRLEPMDYYVGLGKGPHAITIVK